MAHKLLFVAAALCFMQVIAGAVYNAAAHTCETIKREISPASTVEYPGVLSPILADDATAHWFQSSNQVPTCVVEPASALDVSIALRAIAADRTPFAVMSGGHASNPGFSSTQGVHISLRRLNQVVLSSDRTSVEIGFGQGWMDVYKKLDATGINVVGGRVPGPGVGGFTLGGGYSWKTNQHGLTCDTVKLYNLVLPNGTITTASENVNPDIFFALKGGLNRFGIVTSAVLNTHPQTKVHGGLIIYPATSIPALLDLTANFSDNNTDPKTQIITTIGGSPTGPTAIALLFHDGPTKPTSLRAFEAIPHLVDTVETQSFLQFVEGIPSELAQVANRRGAFATFSTSNLTPRFLYAIQAECELFGKIMAQHGGLTASYDIEPFTRYGQFATESAYPHGHSPLPLNLYFSWADKSEDEFWHKQMRESLGRLKQMAVEEQIYSPSLTQYPNYALAGAAAEELYGHLNAARLREIRRVVDPLRVMDLAGGFEI
ncbi:hypothetical protein QBC47DRAFT_63097 [Echria macrotheca]|uniref:FAD-binding PCMH-type domain-containing protein n=1 Tax=Echria macrotheca TaxID=438768 RepID=A0AAJ0F2W9_9PEZI|nr:hypothetical protein QBC47DRAFT_63097 [Echria macrotheca]